MRHPRFLSLIFLGVLVLSSCARRMPEAEPADIPGLEEALERDPGNPEILLQLGVAHFKARNYAEAEETLLNAVGTGEATGAAYLYLGLAREEQEKWGPAREAYSTYLELGRHDPLKEDIRERLALLARRELRVRAREILAREDEISRQDPVPGSVAVFPFRITTENEELEPLQVALADMMTTDLVLSGGLTVLERARVQSLLTEMSLTEAGFTSPETGARAGRMLRAEHVVQGALTSLSDEILRFDTDVLNTSRRSSAGEASAQDALARLFEMEKEAVFEILDIMGVSITPAEREAIQENRASNLLAFLTYGQGLMAMDQGYFGTAQQFFTRAVREDPGFTAAQGALTEANTILEATTLSTSGISSLALPELSPLPAPSPVDPEAAAAEAASTVSSVLEATTEGLVPSPFGFIVDLGGILGGIEANILERNYLPEIKGQEGVTTPATATIRIIITPPGGGG